MYVQFCCLVWHFCTRLINSLSWGCLNFFHCTLHCSLFKFCTWASQHYSVQWICWRIGGRFGVEGWCIDGLITLHCFHCITIHFVICFATSAFSINLPTTVGQRCDAICLKLDWSCLICRDDSAEMIFLLDFM
jgi:hypothetical protein